MDGNYFIDCLLGADVRIIDAESYRSRRGEIMEELAAEYAAAGRKAYIIPEGASNGHRYLRISGLYAGNHGAGTGTWRYL